MTITYELKGYVTVCGPDKNYCDEKLNEALMVINDHDDISLNIIGEEEVQQEAECE